MENAVFSEKLAELEGDAAFVERLRNADTVEEVGELLREAGMDISPQELRSFAAGEGPAGELDETALEGVAGGMLVTVPVLPILRWWEMLRSGGRRAGSTVHTSSSGSSHGGTKGRKF